MTPGIRSFPGDLIGDGTVNLLWVNGKPNLGGANPCDPPASEGWPTSIYKLSPPAPPQNPTWTWAWDIQNYWYSVPNNSQFEWLAAGDIDGDGYLDRMSLIQKWSSSIVPGHWCHGDITSSAIGVERTLRDTDGTINAFSQGQLQPNYAQDYRSVPPTSCPYSEVPWTRALVNYFDEEVLVNYNNSLNGKRIPLPVSPPLWLQDMDGDGLEDVVIYSDWDQQGVPYVSYYPGRGDGHFGANETSLSQTEGLVYTCANASEVAMQNSPNIAGLTNGSNPPDNKLPYFINDVTGDGLADFIQVVGTGPNSPADQPSPPWELQIFQNIDGTRFDITPIIVSLNGTGYDYFTSVITFADMTGIGVDNIAIVTTTGFWVVPLLTGERPLLLKTLANGYGATTTLTYSTTAQLSIQANGSGEPWTSETPQSLDVVVRVETSNGLVDSKGAGACTSHATDRTTTFVYRDPVYDFREREFLGFREVTAGTVGDSAIGNQFVTVDFVIDPTPAGYVGGDDPYESVHGLPAVTKRWSDGGTLSLSHNEYNFSESVQGMDTRSVYLVYPEQADEWIWSSPNSLTEPYSIQDLDAPAYEATIQAARTISVPADRGSPHLQQTRKLSGIGNNMTYEEDHGVVGGGVIDTGIFSSLEWAQQGQVGSWIWRTTTSVTGYDEIGAATRQFTYLYDNAGNNTDVVGTLGGTRALNRFDTVPGAMTAPLPPTRSSDGTITLLHRDMDPAGSGNVLMDHRPDNQCVAYSYDACRGRLSLR